MPAPPAVHRRAAAAHLGLPECCSWLTALSVLTSVQHHTSNSCTSHAREGGRGEPVAHNAHVLYSCTAASGTPRTLTLSCEASGSLSARPGATDFSPYDCFSCLAVKCKVGSSVGMSTVTAAAACASTSVRNQQ
jgi:hypothetical protein